MKQAELSRKLKTQNELRKHYSLGNKQEFKRNMANYLKGKLDQKYCMKEIDIDEKDFYVDLI